LQGDESMTAAMAAQPTMASFGRVRTGRTTPSSWRILLLALVIGTLAQASALTLPLLAALGIFGVWRTLAPMASSQVVDPTASGAGRKPGWRAFVAALATLSAYLIFAIEPVEHWFRFSEHRQAVVSLTAVTLLLGLCFCMSAQGWSFASATLTGLTAFAALAAAVWYATTEPVSDAHWSTTFLRLAMVVGAAELMTPAVRRSRRWRLSFSWEGMLRGLTLLLMLALVLQAPGAVRDSAIDPVWWTSVTVLVGAAVGWIVWQARVPVLLDWRWWASERKTKPMPTPLAVSFAFVPAVGAAALANWPVWLVAFTLGVVAAGITRVGAIATR
jgi:hypothetical protein